MSSVLAKMAVKIAADTAEFKREINKTQSELKGFQSNITKMAGTIGVAFGVSEVARFALEISKLAGEAEGVERAFNKLPNSKKLLDDLKKATSGTVSELELMKRTVQASNFGISLESLPKLLEFAAVRAQQTGQSVDSLVDSIVNGIGRKSALILDNLGISAARLKDEFGGASLEAQSIGSVAAAVGRIAEQELNNMGSMAENTATKIDRLSASWENLKIEWGKVANDTGILSFFLDLGDAALKSLIPAGNAMTNLTSEINEFNRALKTGYFTGSYAEQLKELEAAAERAGVKIVILSDGVNKKAIIDSRTKIQTKQLTDEIVKNISTLEELKKKIDELNHQFVTTDVNDKKELANIGSKIIAINAEIDALEALRKKQAQLQTNFGKTTEQNATAYAGTYKATTEFKEPSLNKPNSQNPISTQIPDADAYESAGRRIAATNNLIQLSEQQKAEASIIANEQIMESQRLATDAALEYGNAIGQGIGQAIAEQQSFANAMRRLTAELVKIFLQRALAGIISKAATETPGPPPVALAAAAIGVAAITAMFSRIGSSGGGGAGASSAARRASRGTERASGSLNNKGFEIQVGGELIIEGDKLRYIINRTEQKNGRTRGN